MKIIETDKAPASIGPYSQAIEALGFVFVSGQLGLDPASGNLAGDGVEAQAEQALKNAGAILKACGSGAQDVVDATIYLADMDSFGAINAIYEKFFGSHKPARATVEVSRLPKNAKVEIKLVAVKKGNTHGK